MKALIVKNITLYDVLGVTAGAATDTIRRARDERLRQLRPGLEAGAPAPVVAATTRAREAVEVAALVLGDAGSRSRYDQQIGLHHDRRLRGSPGFAEDAAPAATDPYDRIRTGTRLLPEALLVTFTGLLAWMTPLPAPPARHVAVPDLRGLFYRPCQSVATMSGFRLSVVRLTADPEPVEGLVTGQWPAPGTAVRRHSLLTVQVWHPARGCGARPGGARTRSE